MINWIKDFTPTQKLAIELHNKNCKGNHTDYCDWEYDVRNAVDGTYHNWDGYAHKLYLEKAEKI